ncbi:hypothetical protein BH20ACT15_BH20ACT15_12160 [soil metagenome]
MSTERGPSLQLLDGGRPVAVTFEQMLDFHAGNSPGGVAHAYKVLERGLPLIAPGGPPERREIAVRTAFGGPGARDGFEFATLASGEGRYVVDPALARPERGRALERFVFELRHGDAAATLVLREGYVSDEFIDLARDEGRSEAGERRLTSLKAEMAELVMSRPAAEVYDAERPEDVRSEGQP